MKILLIRHAIAEDPDPAMRDAQRKLTDKGAARMREEAQALSAMDESWGRLLCSPYLRAVQTAEIVSEQLGLAIEQHRALAPGGAPEDLLGVFSSWQGEGVQIAIGHEPDLSFWASWALSGHKQSFLALKKGGACMLDFHRAKAGAATLQWLALPRQLRGLA